MESPAGPGQPGYLAAIDVRLRVPLIPEPVFAKVFYPGLVRKCFTQSSCEIG